MSSPGLVARATAGAVTTVIDLMSKLIQITSVYTVELSGAITGLLLPVLVISLKDCVTAPRVQPASLGDILLM